MHVCRGAGFSISRHFVSFHAFLTLNILTHTEETQFVQRLRFVMDELCNDANRQSYMYMEKGRGKKYEFSAVLDVYNFVRRLFYHSDGSENGLAFELKGLPISNLEGILRHVL